MLIMELKKILITLKLDKITIKEIINLGKKCLIKFKNLYIGDLLKILIYM
jgi:hypothetical protein